MKIEEAIKLLNRIDIKNFLTVSIEQSNYIIDEANKVNNAIETVLNELEKNTETINSLINEVTIKDSESELKDQVIWFMANRLTTEYHDIDWVTNYYYEEAKNYLEKSKTENN